MASDMEPVVYIRIPLIESWNLTFDYDFKYIFKSAGRMSLTFKNVTALMATTVQATTTGHAFPQIHDIVFDFGQSEIYDEKKGK